MNILIENADTLEFLISDGHWTKKAGEGTSFPTTQRAYAAAKREPIGKFNIVGYFADRQQFVNMERGSGKGH